MPLPSLTFVVLMRGNDRPSGAPEYQRGSCPDCCAVMRTERALTSYGAYRFSCPSCRAIVVDLGPDVTLHRDRQGPVPPLSVDVDIDADDRPVIRVLDALGRDVAEVTWSQRGPDAPDAEAVAQAIAANFRGVR